MSESKLSKSSWIIVVVIVLVVGAVVIKQVIRREASSTPVAVASPAPIPSPAEQPAPSASQPAAVAAKPSPHMATPRPKLSAKLASPAPVPTPKTAPPAPVAEQPVNEIELITGDKLEECFKSGRPTIADFGAGWCKACQMMEPVLKEAAKKYEGKLNIVYVNVDDYPNIARSYRIGPIPTQVFLDKNGKEVGRHIGYYPLADFEAQMKQFGVIE